jgi:hypothetical protein
MKHGLRSSKPKFSILQRHAQVHQIRGTEYGADKYARGNYHGAPPAGVDPVQRLLGYIDATQRHLTRVAEAINRAIGTGGDVVEACQTRDTEASGGFPASNLPDLTHAMSSLGIGISCAVDDGLLPADPGQPWRTGGEEGLPQKDDAAAERARVEAMHERAFEKLRDYPAQPEPRPRPAEFQRCISCTATGRSSCEACWR